jgi:transcriptional antiterminator Rof (Rho-off)
MALWYWVSATFKAVHSGRPRRRHLWERTVFLLQVEGDTDIHAAARDLALAKEHEYLNPAGETVRWVLQEIERIESLHDDLGPGAEVFWQFFERVDPPTAPTASESGSPSRRSG